MILSLSFFCQAEDGIRDVAVTGVQTCALSIQAEDGIRDVAVTGVQTCALPIPDAGADSAVTLAGGNTITFTNGYANPEMAADSGDIIYIENRDRKSVV